MVLALLGMAFSLFDNNGPLEDSLWLKDPLEVVALMCVGLATLVTGLDMLKAHTRTRTRARST